MQTDFVAYREYGQWRTEMQALSQALARPDKNSMERIRELTLKIIDRGKRFPPHEIPDGLFVHAFKGGGMNLLDPAEFLVRVRKTIGKQAYSGRPIETTADFTEELERILSS